MRRQLIKVIHSGVVFLVGLLCVLLMLESGLRGWGAYRRMNLARKNKQAMAEGESFTIMCLGESTTVNQYPRFLAEELKSLLPEGNFAVIDKGLTAVNSYVIISRLETFLNECEPDLVVSMMGCNDAKELLDYGNVRSPRVLSWMRRCRVFALFRLLWWNFLNVNNDADSLGLAFGGSGGTGDKKNIKTLCEREQELKSLISRNPTDIDALVELARIKEKQGYPVKAHGLFLLIYELDPDDPRSYFRLAFYEKHKEDMLKWVDLMLAQRNHRHFDLFEAVEILLFTKNFGRARKLLEESVVKNSKVYSKLGQIALLEGRYKAASGFFESALSCNPGNSFLENALNLSRFLQPGRDSAASVAYVSKHLRQNYNALASILAGRGIRLVAAQYPMLDVRPLKDMLARQEDVVFVDNSMVFRRAVLAGGYSSVFIDNFGGCFGHCTDEGNRLLARNIARRIAVDVFGLDLSEKIQAGRSLCGK